MKRYLAGRSSRNWSRSCGRGFEWWETEGKPHYEEDRAVINTAVTTGSRKALLYTAAVPAILAVGFLILLLYFVSIGGYKPVHIDTRHGHPSEV